MIEHRDTLIALLREASRQSEQFQSLIHDYALDVMGDPETHRLFATQLNSDPAILRRIGILKASFESSSADLNGISAAMNEVLAVASALPASSHTGIAEIVNLVAVELAYRRIDQGVDEPLAASRRPRTTNPGSA